MGHETQEAEWEQETRTSPRQGGGEEAARPAAGGPGAGVCRQAGPLRRQLRVERDEVARGPGNTGCLLSGPSSGASFLKAQRRAELGPPTGNSGAPFTGGLYPNL